MYGPAIAAAAFGPFGLGLPPLGPGRPPRRSLWRLVVALVLTTVVIGAAGACHHHNGHASVAPPGMTGCPDQEPDCTVLFDGPWCTSHQEECSDRFRTCRDHPPKPCESED